VGNKSTLFTLGSLPAFTWIYKHPALSEDQGDGYFIGESSGALCIIHNDTSEAAFLTYANSGSGETAVLVDHIGKILRVVTTYNSDYFYYLIRYDDDSSSYVKIDDLTLPRACFYNTQSNLQDPAGEVFYSTEEYSTLKEVEGGYVKKLSELRNSGYTEGHCLFMLAYRMFDGTFIMHSHPYYVYVGASEITDASTYVELLTTGGGTIFQFSNIMVGTPSVTFDLSVSLQYSLQNDYKGIINSLCVFMVRPRSNYIPGSYDESDRLIWDKNVQSIIEEQNYYLVKEITVDQLISNLASSTDDSYILDVKNLETLETNESLPVDNYSHHKVFGQRSLLYNQRIHMGDVTTIFGPPQDMYAWFGDNTVPVWGWTMESDSAVAYPLILKVYLHTDQGDRSEIFTPVTVPIYNTAFYLTPPILSYPDDRAYKLEFWQYDTVQQLYRLGFSMNLTAHPSLNFSYYANWLSAYNTFASIGIDTTNHGPIAAYTTAVNSMREPNRIQVTEQNNIWVNLAKHSYRVGSLENGIIGLSTQAEPLSEGQYGEFPVCIFSDHGVYFLEQGDGEVLYASIQPLSKDICNNANSITEIGSGIVFATSKGLKMIVGRQVAEISEPVEGKAPDYLITNEDFANFIDSVFVADVIDSLSNTPFITFLATARIAYDHKEEELIISNNTISSTFTDNYSYVFSFRSKLWFKRSEYWDSFINNYPGYIGIRDSVLYDLSAENEDEYPSVIIQTRPFMISGSFTKVSKAILRCLINTKENTHFAALLFGSTSGSRKYWLLNGSTISGSDFQQVCINRVGGSFKYYVLVLVGQVSDSELTHIEFEFTERYNNRIR
jgi:hypothetical protein